MAQVAIEVPKEFAFNHQRIIKAYQGPISRNFQTYTATNNSIQSIQFSIQTPSRKVLIRKNIMVYYQVKLVITAIPVRLSTFITTTNVDYFSIVNPGQGDAPRFMPISQNVISFQGSIGDVSVSTTNTNLYIDVLSRYSLSPDERTKYWGTFPSYSDPLGPGLQYNNNNFNGVNATTLTTAQQSGLYGSFNQLFWANDINTQTVTGISGSTGTLTFPQSYCLPSLKNPLTSGTQGNDKRGDYYYYYSPTWFTSATSTTQSVQFVTCEPLLGLSGFGQTSLSREAGFANVQSMSFNINLSANPNMWSHDISVGGCGVASTGAAILPSSVVASFPNAPQMIIEYWTTEEKLKIYQNPYYYPYSAITYFTQPTVSFTANQIQTINFQNVQMTSVPQEMYVFCRVSANTTQYLNTSTTYTKYSVVAGAMTAMDNYAGCPVGTAQTILPTNSSASLGLNSPVVPYSAGILNITFDNSPSQLAGMNSQQIYNMCLENGLMGVSFADFTAFGGIYKIIFGKDVFSANTNEVVLGGTVGSYNIQVQAAFQNNFSQTLIFQPILVTVQQGYIKIGPDGNELILNALNNQNLSKAVEVIDKSNILESQKGGSLLGTASGVLGSLAGYASGIPGLSTVTSHVGKFAGDSAERFLKNIANNSNVGGKRISKKQLKRGRHGGYTLN